MLFSLKFQRNNRQNALATDSADGKTEKAVCSPRCEEEATTCHDRALFICCVAGGALNGNRRAAALLRTGQRGAALEG